MALTTTEVNKINDLYNQLDVLAAENKLLRETVATSEDVQKLEKKLEDILTAIQACNSK